MYNGVTFKEETEMKLFAIALGARRCQVGLELERGSPTINGTSCNSRGLRKRTKVLKKSKISCNENRRMVNMAMLVTLKNTIHHHLLILSSRTRFQCGKEA